MDRETKTLMTPSGKEVVIKTYLTPRETRLIESAPMRFADIGLKDVEADGGRMKKEGDLKGFDVGSAMSAREDELIRQSVVSFDRDAEGKQCTDKILDRILDGRTDDYKFIVEAVDEMQKNPVEPK